MTGIPYGWLAYAAANSAVGAALGGGFGALDGVVSQAGAGVIALALGVKTLTDLNAAYGPLVASVTVPLSTGLGLAGGAHSDAPAAASVALFVLAHSARKVRAS